MIKERKLGSESKSMQWKKFYIIQCIHWVWDPSLNASLNMTLAVEISHNCNQYHLVL